MTTRMILLTGLVSLLATSSSHGDDASQEAAKIAFFEKKVRPILANHCYSCHAAETKPSGNLRVDDRNGLLTGGNSGPTIVPGKPNESLLLKRINETNPKRKMPVQGESLTPEQVEILTTWIKDGAAWPKQHVPASIGKIRLDYEELKKDHWAWQPLKKPAVPTVSNATWAKDDVDRFVLATLEAKKLKPVGAAAKDDLLRRVTFDLTGLPPTASETEAFLSDNTPEAFTKVVDRLLASPRFGERWGRHWLDVARYGESTGPSRNIPYPHAWKYRDYVIDSFNADVPYNRFITEQIAGDLLEAKTPAERDRLLTATGFLALGVKDVNQRFKVRFIMDNVDEQIDAVTRSTLALTVSCARCHDHKFDPIPQTDYYALAGIFTSTENAAGVRNKMGGGGLDYYDPANLLKLTSTVAAPDPAKLAKLEAEVAESKKAWDAIRGTPEGTKLAADGFPTQRPFRLKYEKLQADLLALTDPASRGHAVHGVRESAIIADTEVRIRGEAEKLGPIVPRGFLNVFRVPGAAKIGVQQSGRLQLAQWLTHEHNALAQRVIVNRVWQHLFAQGLVNTVDNFGVTGGTPSHPELLDHLAARFTANGWSIKKLIRSLVLTQTYQMATTMDANNRTVDPGNRLLWRHTPRRLDSEEIRDRVLAAAGTLKLERPTGSPAQALKMIEMRDNGPEAKNIHEAADKSHVRSVYLPLLRGVTPHHLEAFDPVDQTLVSGNRETTTVPSQALFLLNSSFIRKHALHAAEQALQAKDTDAERVQALYQRTLNRSATATEVQRALAFVGEYESAYRDAPPVAAPPPPKPKPKAKAKANEPPFDPDQVDQTGETIESENVQPKDARRAAWMALVQALYGSVEFRFVK